MENTTDPKLIIEDTKYVGKVKHHRIASPKVTQTINNFLKFDSETLSLVPSDADSMNVPENCSRVDYEQLWLCIGSTQTMIKFENVSVCLPKKIRFVQESVTRSVPKPPVASSSDSDPSQLYMIQSVPLFTEDDCSKLGHVTHLAIKDLPEQFVFPPNIQHLFVANYSGSKSFPEIENIYIHASYHASVDKIDNPFRHYLFYYGDEKIPETYLQSDKYQNGTETVIKVFGRHFTVIERIPVTDAA